LWTDSRFVFREEQSVQSTATSPPAVQTMNLPDGRKLGYRELGDGPAVLLLHGWPTSSYLWRGVMPPIARSKRVLALDMPGFGASDKPLGAGYGFDFFEDAVDGFLDALGVEEVALAGHDLGGPIVLDWALRRPDRVTSIALLNTLVYPDFSPAVIEFVRELMTPDSRDRITSPEGLTEVMRLGVVSPASLPEQVLAEVVAPFQGGQERLALAQAGIGLEPGRFTEIAEALPTLGVPVRIVYGAQDRILPDVADTMSRLQRDLPNVRVTALRDRGHFLQEEAPEEVGELLAEFFA
jgi:pimeloyl-ACP methyl ester carboxylesterase